MKSFTAVYIAAKTPKSESIIVKTGFSNPASLSSLVPPHTVTSMMPAIWNARPEYRAKSFIPLFSEFFGLFFFDDCSSSIIVGITHFAAPRKFCPGFNRKF